MIRPTVEVLLSMVDQFSAPFRAASQNIQDGSSKAGSSLSEKLGSAMRGVGDSLKSLGQDAANFLSNKLVQGVGLVGLVTGLNKSFEAADRFRVAAQKLEGTAKITGVSLDWLQGIAGDAAAKFGLSKVQASDFAVEMAKLATKAGDVGKAGPALEAFLDIGAARGLTAAETLKAVQQSILGIDEGTDKLFNANPSVLYAMFAESIGTTAAKLTDQQKAQALLSAAMEDGSKVMGQYSVWLETVAGESQMAANRADEANAKLGKSLETLRIGLADAKVFGADLLTGVVQTVQLAGEYIGYLFARLPLEIELAWNAMLAGVGAGVQKLGSIIPFVGDTIEEAGRVMLAKHRETGQAIMTQLSQYEQFHAESQAEILGIDITGAQRRFAAATAGEKKITSAKEEGGKDQEKAAKESGKKLEALEKLAHKSSLALLTVQQREYQELVADFQEKMQGMNAADRAKAEALLEKSLGNLVVKHYDAEKKIVPTMKRVRESIDDMGGAWAKMPPKVEPAIQTIYRLQGAAAEMGPEFSKAAQDIFQFVDALGIADPRVESLVGGIGTIGDALTKLGTGDFFGGITAGISGVTSILGGIFGDSPADKERKALLAKNNQRLLELKDEIGTLLNLNTTGAKLDAFKGVDIMRLVQSSIDTRSGNLGIGQVGQFLAKQGLGLKDFRDLADELGIDLGDDGKNFNRDAVMGLLDFVQKNRFVGFDQSVQGQVDRLDFEVGTTGGGDQDTLQGLARILSQPGTSPAFGRLFTGINTSDGIDGTEIATIRQRSITLGSDFASGRLTERDLGSISNREFQQLFERLLGVMTSVAENTETTAAASAVTAAATAATADAVTGNQLPTIVDTGIQDQLAITTRNGGGA
jgi:hypothetical protein